ALHRATENNYEKVLETLLNNNADINLHTEGGEASLHWAAINGHREPSSNTVVHLLLGSGAEVAAQSGEGKTALSIATE
ncbi:uncharacterized protein TRIVIDRAFT_131866, partial [Trichoderma virens Gv29-8]